MIETKVRIGLTEQHPEDAPIIPITVPEMTKIRQLADDLHAKEQPYNRDRDCLAAVFDA